MKESKIFKIYIVIIAAISGFEFQNIIFNYNNITANHTIIIPYLLITIVFYFICKKVKLLLKLFVFKFILITLLLFSIGFLSGINDISNEILVNNKLVFGIFLIFPLLQFILSGYQGYLSEKEKIN